MHLIVHKMLNFILDFCPLLNSLFIIPAKAFARDYVITGVGLFVCLSVCYHDR